MITDLEFLQLVDTKTLVDELARRIEREGDETDAEMFGDVCPESLIILLSVQYDTFVIAGLKKEKCDSCDEVSIRESYRIFGTDPSVGEALLLLEGTKKGLLDDWASDDSAMHDHDHDPDCPNYQSSDD